MTKPYALEIVGAGFYVVGPHNQRRRFMLSDADVTPGALVDLLNEAHALGLDEGRRAVQFEFRKAMNL